jgi:hypothetical protein
MKSKWTKALIGLSFLSIMMLGFANCDKIAEALNLDSPFSATFIIDIGANDPLLFLETKEIDLSSNQDFQNNKDKIENFTINEVYYLVNNYIGEPGILGSGSITFLNGSTQIGDAITQTDVDFFALFESGDKTVIPISDATKNALQNTLKDEMKVTVKIEGLMSDKPVYVDLELYLQITAKVNP